MSSGARTSGRQLSLGLADTAVSSLGNLAVSVIAARAMPVDDFGVFTTGMIALLLVTGLSRAVHGDVLVLTSASADPRDRHERSQSSLDSVALSGCAVTTAVAALLGLGAAVGAVESRSVVGTVAACAAAVPLLLLQDHLRWVEYARGRADLALVNNTVWSLGALVLLAGALWSGAALSPAGAVLLWAAGTLPAICFGLRAAGVQLRPTRGRDWLAVHRTLAGRLLQDHGLLQATAQGALLLLAALSTATDVGLLRKAQIFLAPITVATNGLMSALQPLLVARAASGHRSVVSLAARTGAISVAGAASYVAVLVAVPADIPGLLVGQGWEEARRFLTPLTVHVAAGLLGGCAGLALRVLGQVGRQVAWRWALAPLSVLAVIVGTSSGGALGGAWALAGANGATLLAWCVLLHWSRPGPREHDLVGTGSGR